VRCHQRFVDRRGFHGAVCRLGQPRVFLAAGYLATAALAARALAELSRAIRAG